MNINENYNLYKDKYKLIAGVDEVGRGPLVGAVVAAAVILPEQYNIDYLADSKKLTEKKREIAFKQIQEQALAIALGRVEAAEIDRINILQASLKAMTIAVEGLEPAADFVLIDGNFIPKKLAVPAKAIIKGDMLEQCISAAAIIAKVTRDREMLELDQKYPQYGFAKHKGYPTKAHFEAIAEHGVLDEHRRSFAPVRKYLEQIVS